jgi:serine/threonine protein kinase
MIRARYLRDVRHVDKYLYMLNDGLFYEPAEKHYQPLHDYITLVTELVKSFTFDWIVSRDGFWYHVHPKQFSLPVQGWKVHVSATPQNGASILKKTVKVALQHKVPLKFALDRNVLSTMGSKRWNRGGSGKFITLYPSSLSSFKELLEGLYGELRNEKGPYILSDKRYKDCSVLYYRYGGIARNARMDITGQQIPVLVAPGGEMIPDIRTPYFAPPSWATDPFPNEDSEQQEITVNNGKYIVKQALAFSNSGGVYLAQDRDTGLQVVIKEARAYTVVDDRGNDAIHRLKKEQHILELLEDTGVTPRPLGAFHEWENYYLVEEYVDGINIRDLMLSQSSILRAKPTFEETFQYYETFREVFKNLARAVSVLHKRGIVYGDLSPINIKLNADTHAVRLIDLEVAFRPGVDQPTYLYTPGFRSVLRAHKETQGFEEDFYSLAAVMMYALFPIATFSSLRNDLFDIVLMIILTDIGWSETELSNIINGLLKNEISLGRVCELLDTPARILPPLFTEDIDAETCDRISHGLGSFILTNMRDGQEGLFPADPFMHETNTLSLGFGACGVLYMLEKCGFEVPKAAYTWLEQELDAIKPENLPPGLFTGSSGIAWSIFELGFEDRAAELMKMANSSAILKDHHSYFYGMAGVGMANLYMYIRTKKSNYLAFATELADSLLESALENDHGIFWEHEHLVQLGYGYGQSGVALFLLRLSQLSGKDKYLCKGRRALEFDLSHGVENERGVMSFPRGPSDTTIEPYLEEGSAGIAKVAMRYGMWNPLEKMLADVHRKYAIFPSLMYGLGSFVDVLTDAFLFSNDAKYLQMAKRPLAGIRDIYLMKQPTGFATPGDGLFKISCDYATGTAGIMRTIYRFTHLNKADFVLDEVDSGTVSMQETAPAKVQTQAAPVMN